MFTQIMDKSTRSVKYAYQADGQPGDPPTWTIEFQGSYAPGWEHERFLTLAVRSVGITMYREGAAEDEGWVVKGILVETEAAPGSEGTIVSTADPEGELPIWLAHLIAFSRFA